MKLLLLFALSSFASVARAESVSVKTIKIMSYNIKALGLRRFARDNRFEKLADAINGLGENKPDILLVQEGLNRKLGIFFEKLNYPYHARGPGRVLSSLSSGLHILSKYPIIATQVEIFDDAAMVDSLIKKGVQFARIKLPDSNLELDIYNTHMQSVQGLFRMLDRSERAAIQTAQLSEIQYLIRRTANPKNILFFGGDLNVREQDVPDIYQNVFREGLENAINMARTCQEDALRCNYNMDQSWYRKIDHLFYRAPHNENVVLEIISMEELFKAREGEFVLSDHAALMGTFAISQINH